MDPLVQEAERPPVSPLRVVAAPAPAHVPEPPASPAGLLIGRLLGLADQGRTPIVQWPGAPDGAAGRVARSTVDLHRDHVGAAVALMFAPVDPAGGDAQPVVIGVLRHPQDEVPAPGAALDVSVDGHRVVLSARQELVLQCGRSSITLRADGQVEVRGERILSQATGANRVQGGSVQLN